MIGIRLNLGFLMKYREVEYLARSNEFLIFVDRFNLLYKIENNQKIILISNCLIIEIYGLVSEDLFYFDISSKDLKYFSSLNRIISDYDSKEFFLIYHNQLKNRTKVLSSSSQVNLNILLKAEQYFFTMIEIMHKILGDYLECKRFLDESYNLEYLTYKKSYLEAMLKSI
jgi:hypothetical protein